LLKKILRPAGGAGTAGHWQLAETARITARASLKNPRTGYTKVMEYQVKKSDEHKGAYLVVAANEATGETLSVLFSGPGAREHAEEYASWKNDQLEVTGEQLLRR
jgi:hypothetical protein